MLMKLVFLDIIGMCPHLSKQRTKTPGPSWSAEWSVTSQRVCNSKQIFIGNDISVPRVATLPYTLGAMEITVHLETSNFAQH